MGRRPLFCLRAMRCLACDALQPIWYTGRSCINRACRGDIRVCNRESTGVTLKPRESFEQFCAAQQARVHGTLSKAMQMARARRREASAAVISIVECDQTTRK